MVRAFIAIGSNIDPAANVRAALHRLATTTRVLRISTVYQTAALDRPGQPPYYNCVAEIETVVPPQELKRGILRSIETSLGRERGPDKHAPRTIDLDLIVYGDLALQDEGLVLPDPEIIERPFLAIPLLELAPELVLPGYQKRIGEIASRLPLDGLRVLPDYTRSLKEEFPA